MVVSGARVPVFRSSYYVSVPHCTNFGKQRAPVNLGFSCRFSIEVPGRACRLWGRNFKSAAPGPLSIRSAPCSRAGTA